MGIDLPAMRCIASGTLRNSAAASRSSCPVCARFTARPYVYTAFDQFDSLSRIVKQS
jgi:hypothetical protein